MRRPIMQVGLVLCLPLVGILGACQKADAPPVSPGSAPSNAAVSQSSQSQALKIAENPPPGAVNLGASEDPAKYDYLPGGTPDFGIAGSDAVIAGQPAVKGAWIVNCGNETGCPKEYKITFLLRGKFTHLYTRVGGGDGIPGEAMTTLSAVADGRVLGTENIQYGEGHDLDLDVAGVQELSFITGEIPGPLVVIIADPVAVP